MELYSQPVQEYKNKFVVTEDKAYFVACIADIDGPSFVGMLNEVFDLDDPEAYKEVDDKYLGGRMILGYYDPSNKEITIHTPLKTSESVEMRLKNIWRRCLSHRF